MGNPDTLMAYRAARKLGLRRAAEKRSCGESGFVPHLDEVTREQAAELPLGCLEIPLKKIRGTYAVGRQSALADNFMPLLEEKTEFCSKWQSVYAAHIREGLRDPIRVYEYLGYYYVREGNKRVSVLRYADAYSYPAEVTRLLAPPYSAEEEARVFNELIGPLRRRPIRHMWFSRTGRYTALLERARAEAGDGAADFLEDAFMRFRREYHACGFTELPLTTGDAFCEYVPVFGFPADTPERILRANVKNCEPQFTGTEAALVVSGPDAMEKRSPLAVLFGRSQRLQAAFIFCGTPKTRYMAAIQDVGRLAAERAFPEVRIHSFCAAPTASDAYEVMSRAVRDCKPDLLFSTERYMQTAALRLSLEAKNTAVLQCSAYAGQKSLSTYYGKTAEAAFLCGALAGALSETGRIGFIPGRTVTGTLPSDSQAFAQGAHTVRPHVRVYWRTAADSSLSAREDACKHLREAGCDHLWLPLLPDSPREQKFFPGVFAFLCRLNASGYPARNLAAAAWHWDAFYLRLLRGLLRESTEFPSSDLPLHFRMGIDTGLVDVHPFAPVLNPWALRLLTQLRGQLAEGRLNAMDESMTAELWVP